MGPSCHPADPAPDRAHWAPWSFARPSCTAAWCAASTPPAAVPPEVVRDLVALAVRAPSAGFSQGWDFLALLDPADREAFWSATDDGTPPDAWRRGVVRRPRPRALPVATPAPTSTATPSPTRAGPTGRPTTGRCRTGTPTSPWRRWSCCSAPQDAGLGALFFGVPVERHDAVREAFGIPEGRRLVGVVALGHEAERVSGSPRTRRRRPLDEVLHVGRFGVS